MKKFILTLFAGQLCLAGFSQDLFMTRTGKVSFHAGTSLEDIDADNGEVTSILNKKTGEIAFNVLIKSFHFRRALMEEHFNENYMESDKFPKATFSGRITNLPSSTLIKEGTYKINVEGDLTIHGITQKVSAPGTLVVSADRVAANSTFKVRIEDYKISIPGLVADKIAKEAEINIDCKYDPRP